MINARNIALLYAILASLSVLLLATAMPPMQNGDEAAHSYRADQLSHLKLFRETLADGELGGHVESGLIMLQQRTDAIRFHELVKISRQMVVPTAWGRSAPMGFPNTAINPPFFYLGSAIAAAVARSGGVPLPHALVLMRLASGGVTVAVATLAISLAGNAAIWLYALLMLPMSLSVGAAVSQDGPLLACTALAVALSIRIDRPGTPRRLWLFGALCALLVMIGMGRSPYLAFVLLLLPLPIGRLWRATGSLVVVVCVLVWTKSSTTGFPVPVYPDGVVSPARQLTGLLLHPWRPVLLAVRTAEIHGDLIARSFIGQLGWLDVSLPPYYHGLAWPMLAAAAAAAVLSGRGPVARTVVLTGCLAMIGAAIGMGLAQYLTWTTVGRPVVEGLQGRYFLAPATVLAVALGRQTAVPSRLADCLTMVVLAFPLLSIAVSMHAIITRYYF